MTANRHWTTTEDAILRANRHLPNRLLAELLPWRTAMAVSCRRSQIRATYQNPRKSEPQTRGAKYQGAPCKHGHCGLRYVASGCCVECVHARDGQKAP